MKNIILIIYFIPLFLFSQKHDYNWIAGRYSPSFGMKIDFSNMPFAIQDSLSLAIWMDNSSCAISDKDGNLAFYCNGYRIANAQHELMINGNIADGDTLNFDFCPQPGSMIIVPNPKNQNQYYVFTLIYGQTYVGYLKYSLVDISANNGKGLVVNKLVTVVSDTLADWSLSAVKHANGNDWWIVVPEKNNHNFYTILVGTNGIEAVQRQVRNNNNLTNVIGAAAFSPNGQKYIYSEYGGELKVFDFNRCTGEISNEKTAPLPFRPGYIPFGVAVSPSNQYLYVSYADSLFQYDLFSNILPNTRKLIAFTGSQGTGIGSMILAPDNKIYLRANYNSSLDLNKLSIIDQPNNMGAACNFLPLSITLPILSAQNGLAPNYPNYRLGAVSSNYCDSLLQLAVMPPQEESSFYVYPNPASDKITLEYSKIYQGGQGEIYNLLGEKVFSFGLSATENKMQINISKFPTGVYSLHLYAARAGARAVRKLVIE